MGLIKRFGKIEYVDKESVHRMTYSEAVAFVLFMEAEEERHKRDIRNIRDIVDIMKQHHHIAKDPRGFYYHKVIRKSEEIMGETYPVIGGDE